MISGLPEKLKSLRSQRGLSQKTIAARLGVSTAIISAYESGERSPSTEMLINISYLFGCSTDFLLKSNYHSNPNIDISGLTDEQVAAINIIIDSMRNKRTKK